MKNDERTLRPFVFIVSSWVLLSQGLPQQALKFGAIASAQGQLGAVLEDDFVVPMKPGLQLLDALEVNHGGAVNAQKLIGMQPGFQIIHGVAQQVHVAADVKAQIVPGRLNPVDFLGAEEKDAPARLDNQPIQELPTGSPRLGAIEKNAQLLAGVGRLLFEDLGSGTLQGLLEAIAIKWLE